MLIQVELYVLLVFVFVNHVFARSRIYLSLRSFSLPLNLADTAPSVFSPLKWCLTDQRDVACGFYRIATGGNVDN